MYDRVKAALLRDAATGPKKSGLRKRRPLSAEIRARFRPNIIRLGRVNDSALESRNYCVCAARSRSSGNSSPISRNQTTRSVRKATRLTIAARSSWKMPDHFSPKRLRFRWSVRTNSGMRQEMCRSDEPPLRRFANRHLMAATSRNQRRARGTKVAQSAWAALCSSTSSEARKHGSATSNSPSTWG